MLAEFAGLYRLAKTKLGIDPPTLDLYELWQIAVMFGLDQPQANPARFGRDQIAERVAAARAGGGSASDRAALAELGGAADAEVGGSLHGVAQIVTGV